MISWRKILSLAALLGCMAGFPAMAQEFSETVWTYDRVDSAPAKGGMHFA